MRRITVAQFPAINRWRRIGPSVPVVPLLGRIHEPVRRNGRCQVHIEVQTRRQEVFFLQFIGQGKEHGVRFRLTDILFNALYLMIRQSESRFNLHLVKPPFVGLHGATQDQFSESIVVAADLQAVHIGRKHGVVIVRVRISAADAEHEALIAQISLQNGLHFVRIERFQRVTKVRVTCRILFQYQIDGPAHCRASKFGRNDTLVNLNAINHVDRDIVDVDKVRIIVHGRLVDKEPDPFSLQAAHGQSCSASHSARRAQCHSDRLRQDVCNACHRSAQLIHGYNRDRHRLFAQLSGLTFGCYHYFAERFRLRLQLYLHAAHLPFA